MLADGAGAKFLLFAQLNLIVAYVAYSQGLYDAVCGQARPLPEPFQNIGINLCRTAGIAPFGLDVSQIFIYIVHTSLRPISLAFARMKASASSKLLPITPSRTASFTASFSWPMVLHGLRP